MSDSGDTELDESVPRPGDTVIFQDGKKVVTGVVQSEDQTNFGDRVNVVSGTATINMDSTVPRVVISPSDLKK